MPKGIFLEWRVLLQRLLLVSAIVIVVLLLGQRSRTQLLTSPLHQGTAAVSGVIVDGATQAPVGGALVQLSIGDGRAVGSAGRQLTDSKGRFVFVDLQPTSRVTIRVSKLGYLDGGYGSGPGASGKWVAVRDGEWVGNVRVPLWRPASLSGTVVDEQGDPVVNVYVLALAKVDVLGHDVFATGPLATTDERGRYRIAGLPPGKYIVQVPFVRTSPPPIDASARLLHSQSPVPPPPLDGRRFAYPAAFSPATPTLDLATPIDLTFGEHRSGVDVALHPVPALRISGLVHGPPESWAGLTLRLLPKGAEGLGPGGELATALVTDGRFTFLNVPAGTYTIDASRATGEFRLTTDPMQDLRQFSGLVGRSNSGTIVQDIDSGPPGLRIAMTTDATRASYWARESLVVGDHDEINIVVNMHATGIMRGRILKDLVPNATVLQLEPSTGIQLDPADGSPILGVLRSDSSAKREDATGEFEILGLLPGKYYLRTKLGWIVKSISWNGRDHTDSPFDAAETPDVQGVEVVVTNGGATLSGIVQDGRAAPASGATVLLFPAEPALRVNVGFWPPRIRSVVATDDGQYEITGMPAGEYRAIAVDRTAASVRPNAAFYNAADRLAAPVSLSWGQSKNIALVVHREVR